MTVQTLNTTVLEERIYMPWQSEYNLGDGYDYLTGKPMSSVLKGVDTTAAPAGSRTMYIRYVRSQSDFEREVKGSIEASGNVEGVTMNVSASFLSKVQYSSTQETLLISWYGDEASFDRIKGPALSKVAAAQLEKDPERFRLTYGEYYLSGGVRHAEFHAMYVLTAQNSSDLATFHASVGASSQDLFSATGSTDFTQKASASSVGITVFVEHTPAKNGAVPKTLDGKDVQGSLTPAAVGNLFEWFKVNAAEGYVVAELTHLAVLDQRLSRVVQVPPSTLVTLSDFGTTLGNCERLHTSLPPRFAREFDKELNSARIVSASEREQLWQDPHALDDSLANVNRLEARMAAIVDFFASVSRLSGGNSALAGKDGGALGIGERGDTTKVPDGVEVKVVNLTARGEWESGKITRRCEWKQPGTRIVHVRISSGWPRAERGRCVSVSGGVGTDNLTAGFEADFDRGLSWTVEIQYVECT